MTNYHGADHLMRFKRQLRQRGPDKRQALCLLAALPFLLVSPVHKFSLDTQ